MTTFEEPIYQLNILLPEEDVVLLDYYNNLSLHHSGDSGIDLFSYATEEIEPLKVGTVNFNIKCEMIDIKTNKYVSYLLVPRSSISNTNFQLANSIGIIDAGYRGFIKAKVRNFNLNQKEFLLLGKYFQICAPDLKPIRINIVKELSDTTRGDGGFGSTGVQ